MTAQPLNSGSENIGADMAHPVEAAKALAQKLREYQEVCPCGGNAFCLNPDENHECKGLTELDRKYLALRDYLRGGF